MRCGNARRIRKRGDKELVNRKLLLSKCYAKEMSQVALAEAIGIDPATLSAKVNNKRPFTVAEVEDIANVLKLSVKDRNSIFFG